MVGDEIVGFPRNFSRIAAHPYAIAAFDFIGVFSAMPTPWSQP
jgi:hypothetical protein